MNRRDVHVYFNFKISASFLEVLGEEIGDNQEFCNISQCQKGLSQKIYLVVDQCGTVRYVKPTINVIKTKKQDQINH